MSLNEGFTETFIFHVKQDVFKVMLNFTKGMCTVYTPNGRILMRLEKLPRVKMLEIKKGVEDYIEGKCDQLPSFSKFKPNRGFRTV